MYCLSPENDFNVFIPISIKRKKKRVQIFLTLGKNISKNDTKRKFSIKDFFSKYEQIRSILRK